MNEVYTDYENVVINDYLYGWWITYNPFVSKFVFTTLEKREDILNNSQSPDIFYTKNINDAIAIIIKAKGQIENVKSILNAI